MGIDNNTVFDFYYQIYLILLLSRSVINTSLRRLSRMYSLSWSSPRGNQMEYSRVHMMNLRDHPRQNDKIASSQCIIVSCILDKESNMNQICYYYQHNFSYFIYYMSYQKVCISANPIQIARETSHIGYYSLIQMYFIDKQFLLETNVFFLLDMQ